MIMNRELYRRKISWNEHSRKLKSFAVSEKSFGEATQNAVAKACQSLRHVDWFEVTEMRGLVEKDQVKEFQVTVIRSVFNLKSNMPKQKIPEAKSSVLGADLILQLNPVPDNIIGEINEKRC